MFGQWAEQKPWRPSLLRSRIISPSSRKAGPPLEPWTVFIQKQNISSNMNIMNIHLTLYQGHCASRLEWSFFCVLCVTNWRNREAMPCCCEMLLISDVRSSQHHLYNRQAIDSLCVEGTHRAKVPHSTASESPSAFRLCVFTSLRPLLKMKACISADGMTVTTDAGGQRRHWACTPVMCGSSEATQRIALFVLHAAAVADAVEAEERRTSLKWFYPTRYDLFRQLFCLV